MQQERFFEREMRRMEDLLGSVERFPLYERTALRQRMEGLFRIAGRRREIDGLAGQAGKKVHALDLLRQLNTDIQGYLDELVPAEKLAALLQESGGPWQD